MSEVAELDRLRVEVTDLGEKLETLRQRRREDRAKLQDYEQCRVQLTTCKSQMSETHAHMQAKLQAAQKAAQDAVESHEAYVDEMAGVSETAEMATLDKEMAEERVEMLQAELDDAKMRIEEMDIKLQTLEEEMDGEQTKSSLVAPFVDELTGNAVVQVNQLKQQNDRLRDALVKMRDASTASTTDHASLTKRFEEITRSNQTLTVANDKYTEDMIDMKEKVDASMAAEQMVELLTDRNLELETKVHGLEEDVETMDQTKVIDEEMAANLRDAERALREELDTAEGQAQGNRTKMRESANRIGDFEKTVEKYRRKTKGMQADIDDLKYKIETLEFDASKRARKASAEEVAFDEAAKMSNVAVALDIKPKVEHPAGGAEGAVDVACEPSKSGAGDAAKENLPPLLETQRQQHALAVANLEWEVEKRTKQINELKVKLLGERNDRSEMKVRYDMAEKRASTAGTNSDSRVLRLKERLRESQKENHKQTLESDMSLVAIRGEVLSLSKENTKLKEEKKDMSQMPLLSRASKYMRRRRAAIDAGGIDVDRQSAVITFLGDELDTTRAALRASEADRWRAEGRAMCEMMAQLKPLNVPRKFTSTSVVQSAATVNLDEMTAARGGQAAELANKVSKMHTEFMLCAHESMRIIDLRDKQKTPMQQLFEQVDRQRQLKLTKEVIACRATNLNGGEGAYTDFGQFTSAKHGKSLTTGVQYIGRSTAPQPSLHHSP